LDAAGRASAGKNFTFVLMHNHGNRKVANLLEQLTELYEAQVMPGIRPQMKMSLTEQSRNNKKRRKEGLNHFLIIMGNVR